ncbi:hypothetical protein BDF19DRAFT_493479 [Syncephalis fuscata]|nr:hypothetical protein BDF19DRAFT_493479 [Syncephalis fuscata]
MTVFRDDFDVPFLAAFAALLFVKIFHWLLQDRVEFMDQTAQLPSSFHTRTLTLLALLSAIDMELIAYAVRVTLSDGVGTWLLFGFEYTILLCTVVTVTGRYALNVIEMRMGEEAWEEKSVFLFYLELIIALTSIAVAIAPAAHTDQYTTQATNAATDGATMVGHRSLNSLDSEMSAQARESAQKEAAEIAAQLNLSEQATCTFMSEFTFLAETSFSPNDATIARLYRPSQNITDDGIDASV